MARRLGAYMDIQFHCSCKDKCECGLVERVLDEIKQYNLFEIYGGYNADMESCSGE